MRYRTAASRLLHFGANPALREPRLDDRARRGIGRIAQDLALFAADDGVTALERRERAHGVQGALQRQQALARAAHALEPRRLQAGE